MRAIISHSEVDSFLSCERRHYYAFGKPNNEGTFGLESKNLSNGLYRGTLGHSALYAYYSYLAPISRVGIPTDADFDAARQKAMEVLSKELTSVGPERMELITGLMVVIESYVEYYRNEDKKWIFSAVETEFREDVDDDITFPFKVDLIRQNRINGRTEVVDHKFLTNLYGGDEIAIQPQLPKYLGTLRNLGYDVNGAVYDLVGTRVLKTKPYDASIAMRRIPVNPTKKRIERSLREQYRVIRQIKTYKDMGQEVWEDQVNRTANSFNCKNCAFLSLCIADLNGEDTSTQVKYDYRPNSYGYSAGSNDD